MSFLLDLISRLFGQLFTYIGNLVGYVTGWISGIVFDIFAWIFHGLDSFFRIFAFAFVNAVGEVLNLLPVPQGIADLQANWNAVPWSTIGYYAEPFQIHYGLGVIVAAALLKFTLRWFPYVGVAFRSPS